MNTSTCDSETISGVSPVIINDKNVNAHANFDVLQILQTYGQFP